MSFVISLFKCCDLNSIKKKLIIVYILNVVDITFTLFLTSTSDFVEVNPIMAITVNNNHLLSLVIKIVLPLIMFLFLAHRIINASHRQLFQSNIIWKNILKLT